MTAFIFSTSFCQNRLCEKPEGPCEPGGESRGARWGDKEGREEGIGTTVAILPEVSAGPQHLVSLVQQQMTLGMPPPAEGSAVGAAQETSTSMLNLNAHCFRQQIHSGHI